VRFWKDIKNLPVIDGWLTDSETGFRARIGDWARIGDEARIGDWAQIGNGTQIGDEAKIGDEARIGDWAQIGNGAKIGNGTQIGDEAKIGNEAQIGDGFVVVYLAQRWPLHPYAPGKVRLGCYIGDYKTLENRTQAEWDKHDYSADHVAIIKASLAYFQAIEAQVFLKPAEPTGAEG
jgi:NDP-sugar pyrophosphorylase family protein